MRVTAGSCGGIVLRACTGSEVTRPTLDGVKQRMFNALSARMEFNGVEVLDLFAGSGALGIEALSRGAEWCTFVDRSGEAIRVIGENLERTKLAGSAEVIRGDFHEVLRRGRQWGLILVDAPFGTGLMNEAIAEIAENGCLADGGLLVVEHGVGEEVEMAGFEEVKRYKAGKIGIVLLQKP